MPIDQQLAFQVLQAQSSDTVVTMLCSSCSATVFTE